MKRTILVLGIAVILLLTCSLAYAEGPDPTNLVYHYQTSITNTAFQIGGTLQQGSISNNNSYSNVSPGYSQVLPSFGLSQSAGASQSAVTTTQTVITK